MNRTAQLTAFLLTTISLTGCGLDVLEGKPSSFQAEQERRAALTSAFVETSAPSPAVAAIEVAAPVQCYESFRVNRCGPEGELPW